MSRILIAWELGEAYGHISALLPLARRLRERRHEILFSVKDTGTASQILKDEGFAFIQAPLVAVARKRRQQPLSFADILAQAGYADRDTLAGLIQAWQGIFQLFNPDILVAEYAPVAQLAARLARRANLQLHTGFSLPPDIAPFPCFRPWPQPAGEKLLQREAELLQNINSVCRDQGFPEFPSLQKALKGDIDLLATLPEIDHYRRRKNGPFIGPITTTDEGLDIRWHQEKQPRIFASLKPGPGIRAVLEALRKSGADVITCIPGADGELAAMAGRRLRICPSRVRLSGLLRSMNLAISNASHGTVAAMLMAGVPMLTIPTTMEQWMLSRCLQRLRIGIEVGQDRIADEFSPAFKRLLSDHRHRNAAMRLAQKYEGYSAGDVLERLVRTIEKLPCRINGSQ